MSQQHYDHRWRKRTWLWGLPYVFRFLADGNTEISGIKLARLMLRKAQQRRRWRGDLLHAEEQASKQSVLSAQPRLMPTNRQSTCCCRLNVIEKGGGGLYFYVSKVSPAVLPPGIMFPTYRIPNRNYWSLFRVSEIANTRYARMQRWRMIFSHIPSGSCTLKRLQHTPLRYRWDMWHEKTPYSGYS